MSSVGLLRVRTAHKCFLNQCEAFVRIRITSIGGVAP